METECELLSIVCDGKEVNKIEPNEEATLITDQSVFYAESGGQVADTGEMTNIKNGIKFYVKDVQKIGGSLFCHRGSLAPDSKALSIGQKLDQNMMKMLMKLLMKMLMKILMMMMMMMTMMMMMMIMSSTSVAA